MCELLKVLLSSLLDCWRLNSACLVQCIYQLSTIMMGLLMSKSWRSPFPCGIMLGSSGAAVVDSLRKIDKVRAVECCAAEAS